MAPGLKRRSAPSRRPKRSSNSPNRTVSLSDLPANLYVNMSSSCPVDQESQGVLISSEQFEQFEQFDSNSSLDRVPEFSFCEGKLGTRIGRSRKRFVGVRQRPSGRWVAEIKDTTQKIRLWLGTFDTAEEAARAYDEAACLLRGSNTRTNFLPPSNSSVQGSALSSKAARVLLLKRNAATSAINAKIDGDQSVASKTDELPASQQHHTLTFVDQNAELDGLSPPHSSSSMRISHSDPCLSSISTEDRALQSAPNCAAANPFGSIGDPVQIHEETDRYEGHHTIQSFKLVPNCDLRKINAPPMSVDSILLSNDNIVTSGNHVYTSYLSDKFSPQMPMLQANLQRKLDDQRHKISMENCANYFVQEDRFRNDVLDLSDALSTLDDQMVINRCYPSLFDLAQELVSMPSVTNVEDNQNANNDEFNSQNDSRLMHNVHHVPQQNYSFDNGEGPDPKRRKTDAQNFLNPSTEENMIMQETLKRMNYERQISASLYAMNGVTECLLLSTHNSPGRQFSMLSPSLSLPSSFQSQMSNMRSNSTMNSWRSQQQQQKQFSVETNPSTFPISSSASSSTSSCFFSGSSPENQGRFIHNSYSTSRNIPASINDDVLKLTQQSKSSTLHVSAHADSDIDDQQNPDQGPIQEALWNSWNLSPLCIVT